MTPCPMWQHEPPRSIWPLLWHGSQTPTRPQVAAQIPGLCVGLSCNLGHRLQHRPHLQLGCWLLLKYPFNCLRTMIHAVQNSKLFINQPTTALCLLLFCLHAPYSFWILATLVLPSTSMEVYIYRFHTNQNIQYLPFCAQLAFLSTISSGFIQTATNAGTLGSLSSLGMNTILL